MQSLLQASRHIDLTGLSHSLSVRALAFEASGDVAAAAADARAVLAADPSHAKARFCLARCLEALGRPGEASHVLGNGGEAAALSGSLRRQAGCTCGGMLALPCNRPERAHVAADGVQADEDARRLEGSRLLLRSAVLGRLRDGRDDQAVKDTVKQLEQSMMGPRWDPEVSRPGYCPRLERQADTPLVPGMWQDMTWRPVFLPAMRLAPLAASPCFRGLGGGGPSTALQYLAEGSSLGSADAPGDAGRLLELIRVLGDLEAPRRMATRQVSPAVLEAFDEALARGLAEQPRAHVLVLGSLGGALALAAARAGAGRVSVIESCPTLYRAADEAVKGDARIHLLPCGVAQVSRGDGDCSIPPAEILVSSMFLEPGVLGSGLLPALDHCAARLMVPGARVLPAVVEVSGQVADVAGPEALLLERLWHPGTEAVSDTGVSERMLRTLTDPCLLARLDLQRRADAIAILAREAVEGAAKADLEGLRGALVASGQGDPASLIWESAEDLSLTVHRAGIARCVVLRFSALLHPEGPRLHNLPEELQGSVFRSPVPAGLQWLNHAPMAPGTELRLRVLRDRTALCIQHLGSPSFRPLAGDLPRWALKAAADADRRDVFERAARAAVASLGGAVTALHVGAGDAALSVGLIRAGCSTVAAVERHPLLAEAARSRLLDLGCVDLHPWMLSAPSDRPVSLWQAPWARDGSRERPTAPDRGGRGRGPCPSRPGGSAQPAGDRGL